MTNDLKSIADEQDATEQPPRPVAWYRTPVESRTLRKLHERSDFFGWLQTLGYLSVIFLSGGIAFFSAGHWPLWVTLTLVFLHGTVFAFQINAVHELGHGTVFKTRSLNAFFDRVFSFLGWTNFEIFEASHARHHRYTLHPPDDLEVVLPIRVMVRDFFLKGFLNPIGFFQVMAHTFRIARGDFRGEWELKLFPASDPVARRRPVNWARTLLIGHGLILIVSAVFELWMLPVLVTFAPFYGSWLFFLCNNTQHIGLQDNVGDFRLCCRTFTLNPLVQFLYWHMNYHIEHHMYAAVPCYRLGRLHRSIKHDLPPCPKGMTATWRAIGAIQMRQKKDPGYQYVPPLPVRAVQDR
jgi:fatty acid desaturase